MDKKYASCRELVLCISRAFLLLFKTSFFKCRRNILFNLSTGAVKIPRQPGMCAPSNTYFTSNSKISHQKLMVGSEMFHNQDVILRWKIVKWRIASCMSSSRKFSSPPLCSHLTMNDNDE